MGMVDLGHFALSEPSIARGPAFLHRAGDTGSVGSAALRTRGHMDGAT
jgi:hypothetical protein